MSRKDNEQSQEETEVKGKAAVKSRPWTVHFAPQNNTNGHVEPELGYVNVKETSQENLDEGLYTDLNLTDREPENIYESLQHTKTGHDEQDMDVYVNVT